MTREIKKPGALIGRIRARDAAKDKARDTDIFSTPLGQSVLTAICVAYFAETKGDDRGFEKKAFEVIDRLPQLATALHYHDESLERSIHRMAIALKR